MFFINCWNEKEIFVNYLGCMMCISDDMDYNDDLFKLLELQRYI